MSKVELNKDIIDALGLTEDQSAVYLASLELGDALMNDLAKKSGVNRTTIYTFIDELKERGLIIETKKGKRRIYSPVHPRRLIEIQKMKLNELQNTMPELLAIFNKEKDKPRVTYYEGFDGIKEVYADMLEEGKEIIAYEDLEHMKETMPESFYNYFPPERAKKEIPFKSISRDSKVAREFVKENTRLLRETKFIKSKDLKTEINIYGDKVAMMSFRTNPPFVVLIENKDIAETMRISWNELWNRLGKGREGEVDTDFV